MRNRIVLLLLAIAAVSSTNAFGQKKKDKTLRVVIGQPIVDVSWNGPGTSDGANFRFGTDRNGNLTPPTEFSLDPASPTFSTDFQTGVTAALATNKEGYGVVKDSVGKMAKYYAKSHTNHVESRYNISRSETEPQEHIVVHCGVAGNYNCSCGTARTVYGSSSGLRYYCPTQRRWVSSTSSSWDWGCYEPRH